jgi:hypothetical protein
MEGNPIVSDHGKRYLKHNPKTVALIGMGPSITNVFQETLTQEFAPDFADEFWTINMASNIVHSDVVFWMDDLELQEAFKPALFAVLRRKGVPVITPTRYPEILPNSYDYPLDEVAAISIPVWGKPYLNNGVAMAVAYAYIKGVEILKMYGCDFSYPNRDYAESGRACVESWVTLGCLREKLGHGPPMEIRMAPATSLFDSVDQKGIYGYKEQPEITLPNGMKWQFQTMGPTEYVTKPYQPEDSSGVENAKISNPQPGTNGGGTIDAGGRGPWADGSEGPPEGAVAQPGESLRHSGGPESDQGGSSSPVDAR